MVIITLNNNKVKLDGDIKALNKMFKDFSFKHPNAFYVQRSMPRGWDRMVHPITPAGYALTGLFPRIIDWLEEHEVPYQVKDLRNLPEITRMPVRVGELKRRPYQRKAAWAILKNEVGGVPFPRGIVGAATNAGKTLIAGLIHSSIYNAKTLILVNNLDLYNQFLGDLESMFPGSWGYMQGKNVVWGSITVCMLPTLSNNLDRYAIELSKYNVIIYDECHLAGSTTAKKVLTKLWHIAIRVGLSGTALLSKDKLRNLAIESYFSREVFKISNLELIVSGFSSQVQVNILKGYTGSYQGNTYLDEFNHCTIHDTERLDRAIERARVHIKAGHFPILVVCKFIEQTERTYEAYREAFPDMEVKFIHHKVPNRVQVLDDFKSGKFPILVSSLVIKVGQNMPLIQYMQNLSAGDSQITCLQLLGRALRKHESKSLTFFDDFYDQGRYMLRHSKHRVRFYKEQGLQVIEEYK